MIIELWAINTIEDLAKGKRREKERKKRKAADDQDNYYIPVVTFIHV